MKRGLKMTTGAKFFLFLLILVPLAYLGASYLKGEDGIANARKMLGIGSGSEAKTNEPEVFQVKEADLQGIQADLNRLETENASLREALHNCELKNGSSIPPEKK